MKHDTAVPAMAALLAGGSTSLAELVNSELEKPPAGGEASRPQLLAAAVAHSLDHDQLEPRVLKNILQRHPEHPIVWKQFEDETAEYQPKDGAPSAYNTLGGLCVHALLVLRRAGAEGTKDMPLSSRAEEWRWQLRTHDEFCADLRDEVDHEGPRGSYTKEKYEDHRSTDTPEH